MFKIQRADYIYTHLHKDNISGKHMELVTVATSGESAGETRLALLYYLKFIHCVCVCVCKKSIYAK